MRALARRCSFERGTEFVAAAAQTHVRVYALHTQMTTTCRTNAEEHLNSRSLFSSRGQQRVPAGQFVCTSRRNYLIYGEKRPPNVCERDMNRSLFHAGRETGEWNFFRSAGDNAHCFPDDILVYGMSQRVSEDTPRAFGSERFFHKKKKKKKEKERLGTTNGL